MLLPSADVCQTVLTVRSQKPETDSEQKDPVETVQLSLKRQNNCPLGRGLSLVHMSSGHFSKLFTAGNVTRSVQRHVFAQSPPPRLCPSDKYPTTIRTATEM